MNNKLILILAFLLGLFITLSVIILNNFFISKKENFQDYEDISIPPLTTPIIATGTDSATEATGTDSATETTGTDSATDIVSNSNTFKTTVTITEDKLSDLCLQNSEILDLYKSSPMECYTKYLPSNIYNTDIDFANLPHRSDIIILINTYNNIIPKIYNANLKWYDEINTNNLIPSMDTYNKNLWFNLSNQVKEVIYDNIIKSININNVELSGPIGIEFTKDENYILKPFSIFFITKINNLKKNLQNTIFELILQTSEVLRSDKIDGESEHKPSVISLKIKENENKCDKYILILKFGDIDDEWEIDKNLIFQKNILLGIVYDGKDIKIIINNIWKDFIYTNKNLKLGSNPFIINKQGHLDMELHCFAFYDRVFNSNDIDIFIKYNNHYINKIATILLEAEDAKNDLNKCEIDKSDRMKVLQDMLNEKNKTIEEYQKQLNI